MKKFFAGVLLVLSLASHADRNWTKEISVSVDASQGCDEALKDYIL